MISQLVSHSCFKVTAKIIVFIQISLFMYENRGNIYTTITNGNYIVGIGLENIMDSVTKSYFQSWK